MLIKSKIAAGLASAALLANLAAPAAFAETNVEIWGNGAKSDNTLNLTKSDETTVTQSNTSNVTLNVTSKAETGGNKANGNTGGSTSIDTGNASSTVGVLVVGGVNAAHVEGCGCEEDTTIKVTNNGKKTNNNATVTDTKKKTATQTSSSTVSGNVKSKAKTGKNKAKNNTSGDVDVKTGKSDSSTLVEVVNPINLLEI